LTLALYSRKTLSRSFGFFITHHSTLLCDLLRPGKPLDSQPYDARGAHRRL
jgi:hypothetical protein